MVINDALSIASNNTAFIIHPFYILMPLTLIVVLIISIRSLNNLGWSDELSFIFIDSVICRDIECDLTKVTLVNESNKVLWSLTEVTEDGSIKHLSIPFNRVNIKVSNSNTIQRVIVNYGREVTTLYELNMTEELLSTMYSFFVTETGEHLTIYNWGIRYQDDKDEVEALNPQQQQI